MGRSFAREIAKELSPWLRHGTAAVRQRDASPSEYITTLQIYNQASPIEYVAITALKSACTDRPRSAGAWHRHGKGIRHGPSCTHRGIHTRGGTSKHGQVGGACARSRGWLAASTLKSELQVQREHKRLDRKIKYPMYRGVSSALSLIILLDQILHLDRRLPSRFLPLQTSLAHHGRRRLLPLHQDPGHQVQQFPCGL